MQLLTQVKKKGRPASQNGLTVHLSTAKTHPNNPPKKLWEDLIFFSACSMNSLALLSCGPSGAEEGGGWVGFAGLPESGASVPPSVLTGGVSAMLRGNRSYSNLFSFISCCWIWGVTWYVASWFYFLHPLWLLLEAQTKDGGTPSTSPTSDYTTLLTSK